MPRAKVFETKTAKHEILHAAEPINSGSYESVHTPLATSLRTAHLALPRCVDSEVTIRSISRNPISSSSIYVQQPFSNASGQQTHDMVRASTNVDVCPTTHAISMTTPFSKRHRSPSSLNRGYWPTAPYHPRPKTAPNKIATAGGKLNHAVDAYASVATTTHHGSRARLVPLLLSGVR